MSNVLTVVCLIPNLESVVLGSESLVSLVCTGFCGVV